MAVHRRLSKVFWQMLCASERNTALFPSSMSQEQRDVRHVSPRLRVTSPRDVGSQLRLPRCSWANDKEGISHPIRPILRIRHFFPKQTLRIPAP
jgi:hypothetical protein